MELEHDTQATAARLAASVDRHTGAVRLGSGRGEVTTYIYAETLAERHHACLCTWVWTGTKFRLKYRHTSCPAMHWHSGIGHGSVSPM